MNAEIIALIPARGGSKGVPRKNIRELGGKPLIAHSIEAARTARMPTRVVVSTDDEEIADIARTFGAEVPFLRPPEYAADESSSISVVQHLIGWLDERGESVDVVALLPPTSPFRKADQIDAVLDRLLATGVRSAATICPVRNHPYFIYQQIDDYRLTYMMEIENRPLRRQDLPVYYRECQSVLASCSAHFKAAGPNGNIIDPSSLVGVEVDEESALDIDSLMDFEIAEMIMERRKKRATS